MPVDPMMLGSTRQRDWIRQLERAPSALGRYAGHARLVAGPGAVRRWAPPLLRSAVAGHHYRVLSEEELRKTRRSETAFVFGSGRSLVDITPNEWGRIATFDTVSLREFPRQHWVRADYHITGEVDFLDEYAARLRENPLYAETIFVVQAGWLAERGNDLIGRRLLREGSRVFRYRRIARGRYAPPSSRLSTLTHGFNSIIDATNFAISMGWRRIVLTGVDLYNKEYFWLPQGETRTYEKPGIAADSIFTGARATIDMLGRWRQLLEPDGVQLSVYNSRSLLASVMPVFSWEPYPATRVETR